MKHPSDYGKHPQFAATLGGAGWTGSGLIGGVGPRRDLWRDLVNVTLSVSPKLRGNMK